MADGTLKVVFVRETPPATPEGGRPIDVPALFRALNTLTLAFAREALLSPDERTEKAGDIVAFVQTQLAVIDQAARQWPSCTPAFPSLEEAQASILPPERTCSECGCWRRYYETWKTMMAPAWWPNADQAERRELERWVRHQARLARASSPMRGQSASPAPR